LAQRKWQKVGESGKMGGGYGVKKGRRMAHTHMTKPRPLFKGQLGVDFSTESRKFVG